MGIVLSLPHMRHFLARGWEVYAICPEGPRLREVREAGVKILPLDLSRRRLAPFRDVRASLAIMRYCRHHRFDLVHTHNIKAGLIGRVASRIGGAPLVVHTMHGMPFDDSSPWPKRGLHASVEWIACRFADRVLVQSEEDLATMRSHRLIAPSKLVKLGNGVPLERFDPAHTDPVRVRVELGLGPDEVLFLSAGRLVRSKGFLELCQAAAMASERDHRIRLAIAGPRDAEKADSLSDTEIARAEAAGVRFLGERTDMPDVYAAADVVVLASWHEGMPRVLMEGAALGKPLLATDARGCREIVTAVGGELVPVRDPAALADAMVRLAADPERRVRAGAANRARAVSEYDLRAIIARLERVYLELLGPL